MMKNTTNQIWFCNVAQKYRQATPRQSFAIELKKARKQILFGALTQEQMANELNICTHSYGEFERARKFPTLKQFHQIIAIFEKRIPAEIPVTAYHRKIYQLKSCYHLGIIS